VNTEHAEGFTERIYPDEYPLPPDRVVDLAKALVTELSDLPLDKRIDALNQVREALHDVSPFKGEPVDFVKWVRASDVEANDYNPNAVAPPEMKLLETSIVEDGYTQPIVAWHNGESHEVVDGFHRNRVGKESLEVNQRIHGYLPLSIIKTEKRDRSSRIASTIRHNRARGKHQVDAMSEIVIELKNRNWKNSRISKELGMDEDEILRLCQITGLSELFADEEFSKSWALEDSEAEFEPVTDEFDIEDKELYGFRTVNTSDPDRVFHTYDKWECYQAGFYNTTVEGMTTDEARDKYRKFFSDDSAFRGALDHIIAEWKHSCEHYLTNTSMNRLAWLGQAAACYALGIPSTFRGGFNLLSEDEQERANNTALEYLNKWLEMTGRDVADRDLAEQATRQMTIY
jgi:ParB-like chromosome segregation protein Spo0J